MTFCFKRWCLQGEASVVLDLQALLAQGVIVDVFLDAHQYAADIELSFPNGEKLSLSFDDIYGRQEDYPQAKSWHELESEKQGFYHMDGEFWRAYEFLTAKSTEELQVTS